MAKWKDQKTDPNASEPLDQRARDINPLGLVADEANCVPLATKTSRVISPNDEYEDRLRASNDYEDRLKALNNDYEDRLRASNNDYEDRLKALTDEYEDKLKASTDDYEDRLRASAAEYEDRLRASAAEYEDRLRATTDKYEDKLKASLRATLDEELPEVREPDTDHDPAPTDEEKASTDNISSRSSDDAFDTNTPQISQSESISGNHITLDGDNTLDTLKCDYLTPIVHVYVGSEKICFLVHRGVLAQSSSLASECKRIDGVETLRLPEVQPQLFVLLVGYLYTQNYQISPSDKDLSGNDAAARFKTHAKVYCLASAFNLDHLIKKTINQMERIGTIGFRSLVEIAREVYPNTQANDIWFKNYFKNEVTIALTASPNVVQDQAILDIYKNDGGRLAVDLYTTIITHYAKYGSKVDETVTAPRAGSESVADVDSVIQFENRAQDMRSLSQAFRTEEAAVDESHDITEPLMTFEELSSFADAEPVDDMITSKVKKAEKHKKHKETEVSALIALDHICEISQPEAETTGAGYCDHLATAQHAALDDTLAEVPPMPEAEPVEKMMSLNVKRPKKDKKLRKGKVSALAALDSVSAQHTDVNDTLTGVPRMPEIEPVEEMMSLNVKKAKKDKKLKKGKVSALAALDSVSAQHADTYDTLTGVPRMPEAEPVGEMITLNVQEGKKDKKRNLDSWARWNKEGPKPDEPELTIDNAWDFWGISKKHLMPTENGSLDSWGTGNKENSKPDEPEQTRDNARGLWGVTMNKKPVPTEKGDIKETDWWVPPSKKDKSKLSTRQTKRSHKKAEEDTIPEEARPAIPPTVDSLDQLSPSTLKQSSAEFQEFSPVRLE